MEIGTVLEALARSTAALAEIVPALTAAPDAALMQHHTRLAEARRRIDAAVAASAAELSRRSHHELGHSGLAQRLGARTPERLVQQLSGVSKREASTLVRVGALMASEPWADSVSAGALSVAAADVIHAGLGLPGPGVSAASLSASASDLATQAPHITLEHLAILAREARDALDEAGVVDRERQRYESRYLRLSPQADGMVRLAGMLDPESAALVTDAFDAVTTPRRSGPRFVGSGFVSSGFVSSGSRTRDSGTGVGAAETALAAETTLAAEPDPRTTDQLRLDSFVEMVRLAIGADSSTLFGDRQPAVRVLVAARDLARHAGSAQLEGQAAPVSIATVERHICSSGSRTVVFDDDGQPINVGRAQRTFTPRQRLALAARDGGCRFTGCDRPPSWTEAHHIIPWSRGGSTDILNGILLCRHHHLLLHNNGWRITRSGSVYHLHPPGGGEPTPMPSRSGAWRAMRVPA
jgi:hypothetical protein